MADARRIARQWLETEAAFGVSEVPVARAKGGEKPAVAASPAAPVRATAMPVPVKVPAAAPRPVVRQEALIPGTKAADMGRKKSMIELPAPPAGDVADMPAMTRKQKEAAMKALLEDVCAACAEYINDISTKVVFGEGDIDAELMFVGEGPGIEEDRTGRPFVGRSGQFLDKMINAMGFAREQVYIANVVKLRCADWDEGSGRLKDRPPTPEEAGRGLPVLHRQIEIVRPKVIVTLGAPALRYVTGVTEGVMKVRGKWLSYRGIPVMPTYHPSFVLRAYTVENRGKVWDDLKAALKKIGREPPKAKK